MPKLHLVRSLHVVWGYAAVVIDGLVGLWGVAMARRSQVPTAYRWAVGGAITALLLETMLGVAIASSGIDSGEQHVFYGVVIAVTFTFTYVYRVQFRKRPGLYYGLLLLFTMGLGIRGIMTFGVNF